MFQHFRKLYFGFDSCEAGHLMDLHCPEVQQEDQARTASEYI